MASPVRRRREQRSWLQWVVIVGGTALVGAIALILMRGAFRVGEDMIASVEDTRPLGRRLHPDEVRARTAKHADVPLSVPDDAASPSSRGTVDATATPRSNAAAASRIAGRVVDSQFAAISRARCQLVAPPGGADFDPGRLSWDWSGSDGRFEIDARLNSVAAQLVVTKRGYRDARIDLDGTPDRANVVVTLVSKEPLTGIVVWPNGQAAAGAKVSVRDGAPPRDITSTATTDVSGRFSIDDLGDGPFAISASMQRASHLENEARVSDHIADAGCTTAIVPPTELTRPFGDVRLVLESDLALRGRVIDARGAPWTRFRASAVPRRKNGERGSASEQVRENFSSADGSFELRGLFAGEWSVSASSGSIVSESRLVVLRRGFDAPQIELICDRGASLFGRVVDNHGNGLSDARVYAFGGGGSSKALRAAHGTAVVCESDGAFSFEAIEPLPARVELVACRGGQRSDVVEVRLNAKGEAHEVVLNALPSGSLQVRALGPGGSSSSRVRVLWSEHGSSLGSATFDESLRDARSARELVERARCGSIVVDTESPVPVRLTAGRYFVWAVDNDWVSPTADVIVSEDRPSQVELQLVTGVEVVLQFRGAERRLEEIEVSVRDEIGAPASIVGDGRARRSHSPVGTFSAIKAGARRNASPQGSIAETAPCKSIVLAPGTYRIEARTRSGEHAEREIRIGEPPVEGFVTLELELRP